MTLDEAPRADAVANKSATEFWFARRFPVDNPRNGMAPVHWKGWLMFAAFAAAMLIGGLGFLVSAVTGYFIWGAIAFVAMAAAGSAWLMMIVQAKGDTAKTLEDYRKKNA
jgi:hypothetical protein